MRSTPDETPLTDVLPILWERCAEEMRERASEVTCGEGCAACCRHLVPLAPAEARRLLAVIAGLPPDRREHLLHRFNELRGHLASSGLWELLLQLARDPAAVPSDGRRWLAEAYRHEQLACPFLDEQERCSIYDERPLACRLQAVTSEPAECYRLHPQGRVVPLRLAGRPAVRALADLEQGDWLPLACLPEAEVPAANEVYPTEVWLARFQQVRHGLPTAGAVVASGRE